MAPQNPSDLVRQLERELYASAQARQNAAAYLKSLQTVLELLAQVEGQAGRDPNGNSGLRGEFKEKKIFSLTQKALGEYKQARRDLEGLDDKIVSAEVFLDRFRFYRSYGFENREALEDYCLAAANEIKETKAVFAPAFLGKIDLNQMASDFGGKVVPAKGVEFPVERFNGLFDYLDARKQGIQARILFNNLKIIRTRASEIYCETDSATLARLDRLAKEKGAWFGED